ncbi:metalloregulator ArsR/SmtB family transcription factor [Bifidobacterium avesanii]|uniref:Metalloregulator ArsR/SmtB family transcription factor n=1 Tax=Bifidobacterium avesanii TaxID=1798157 RepID=A0A7K3TGR2_9BIFI|nr:metalloregulator ArsR/SmtB family transcription factor [Bifidobacterium avesanii]KAB8294365.1 ArsR family transcriptional regulator [Bifidobacterium avesanii]NEG77800.1 metalloregulator ArsR/SmtB family transcription factor [Bifidobacterium avesanii]
MAEEDEGPASPTGRPVHTITDFAQLKALSHPTRMRILTTLSDEHPCTVGDIAEALGESAGTVSYHLKQLEKAGIVTQSPSPDGDRRKSCWTANQGAFQFSVSHDDNPALADAMDQAGREFYLAGRERYQAKAESLPAEWRKPAQSVASVIRLTAEEYQRMSDEFAELTRKWADVNLQHTEGDGSQPVMLVTDLFKWVP